MKGVAHNISAASWPTTSFFIPFSVLTGANASRYPASSRLVLPAAILEKPENCHQSKRNSKTARCREGYARRVTIESWIAPRCQASTTTMRFCTARIHD
jgi:hypothetical protein